MSVETVSPQEIEAEILRSIESAQDLAVLDQIRVGALGKKGRLTAVMKTLGKMAPEQRKEMGQAYNVVKDIIATALDQKKEYLEQMALSVRLESEKLDMTLPVVSVPAGTLHPISQVIDELTVIFADMGFSIAEGPDIEDDFHNFDALNIPPEHPARQELDTFYLPPLKEGDAPQVLRTHTSPVQIRTMMSQKPPIRIICPGKTYRSDYDATHLPNFHQVEGLVIGENIHMGHVKGTLIEFCRTFFELDDLPVRFRPSYFPFTEPSAEMDIGCSKEQGVLKIGGGVDWLEILGCGMINPAVLRNCGLDPEQYQGFAFGMGIERIAMLKYGIPDLRTFAESDLRWLRHYGFKALDIPNLAYNMTR